MKSRSLFALALAATLVPAAALATPRSAGSPSASPMSSGLTFGGFVGYETDDLSGISLRVDGEAPFGALSPQLRLSFVGSIGISHLTDDAAFGGATADATANILKIVPAARFSIPVNNQLTFFADAGLGVYYSSWTIEMTEIVPGFPALRTKIDDNELGLVGRIGAGAWFDVNPSTRIGGMLEFNPYFGDVIANSDQNTFLFQIGAMFRM
jgi:hypothetical protein